MEYGTVMGRSVKCGFQHDSVDRSMVHFERKIKRWWVLRNRSSMGTWAGNLSTWEAKAGESGAQDYSRLFSKFRAIWAS